MMRLELATAEYIGARAQQQDLAAAMPMAAGAVLVLADGLGGHESGAEASRIVVETFKEAGAGGLFNNPGTRRQALRDTLDRANARIADGVDPAHGHRGMASTVVAAVVAHGELSWVSVGDSHLYVWRGGRLSKLNEDHSQAGLMVRSGQYHPSDPEVQAVKSVLVSALTGRKLEIVDLPQAPFRLQPGDVLMLASDGLNTLPDDEIEGMVGDLRGHGAIKLSTALLERVRSRRVERQDNTTVAVARVLEPARQEAVDGPRRAVSDPERPAGEAAARRPAAPPLPIDDALEVRTERITPETEARAEHIASEPATIPVPRSVAAAIEAAGALQRPSSEAPPTPPVTREPVQAKPLEAAGASSASEAPPIAKPAAPDVVAASDPAATEGAQPAQEASPKKPVPAAAKPRAEGQGKPLLDARPAAKPNGVRLVPQGWREVEVDAENLPRSPVKPNIEPAPSPEHAARPIVSRALLGLVLLFLIAGGVAFAAIVGLKPQWLSGVVPGFEARQTLPAPVEPGSQAKTPAAEPIAVPSPVPAVRPSSGPAPRAPEATAPARTEPARRLGADQPQAPPLAASPAPPSGPDAPAPVPGTDAAAPAAATPPAADPPLVEPEKPAARPARPTRAP